MAETGRDTGLEAVPVATAAARLGIAPNSVRKRLQRGTLQGFKSAGKWFVYLPDEGDSEGDKGTGGRTVSRLAPAPPDVVAELREELHFLRAQVERLTELLAEKDRSLDEEKAELRRLIALQEQRAAIEVRPAAEKAPGPGWRERLRRLWTGKAT